MAAKKPSPIQRLMGLTADWKPDAATRGYFAAALGRKGGQATSEAKAQAARRNGRKGGRPKKKKPKP